PDKARYGVFTMLADDVRKRTRTLIEEAAAPSNTNDESRKIGDFYSTFMNEAEIESKGIGPLQPQLDKIAKIQNREQLVRVIGGTLRADVDPLNSTNFQTGNLFGIWVTQGVMDPAHSIPYLLQGGLGLPDRDYYISNTPQMAELRTKYQTHIAA